MPASAFYTAVLPNFDTGIANIPQASANPANADDVTEYGVLGITLINTTAAQVTVRVTDGSGATLIPDVSLPGKTMLPYGPFNMLPSHGLRWLTSAAAGIQGRIWGYK